MGSLAVIPTWVVPPAQQVVDCIIGLGQLGGGGEIDGSFLRHVDLTSAGATVTFLIDVITNVVANIVFWIWLGLTFAAYGKIVQERFRNFFGLTKELRLTICLSNLWSQTSSPQRDIGRARYYIGLNELKASQSILTLFGTSRFRLPDMVRGLVDTMWSSSIRNVDTIVSDPLGHKGNEVQSSPAGSLVVVGGSSFNLRRRTFVQLELPAMVFSDELPEQDHQKAGPRAVIVRRGPGAGDCIESELALGILEKCRDASTGGVIFFCNGSGGDISRAVAEFLTRNWRLLQRKYGEKSFAICLGFPRTGSHLEFYVNPVQLREYYA